MKLDVTFYTLVMISWGFILSALQLLWAAYRIKKGCLRTRYLIYAALTPFFVWGVNLCILCLIFVSPYPGEGFGIWAALIVIANLFYVAASLAAGIPITLYCNNRGVAEDDRSRH